MVHLYENKREYVWRSINKRYHSEFTTKTVKHGIKSLMLWGAIKSDGSRIITRCPIKLNSENLNYALV